MRKRNGGKVFLKDLLWFYCYCYYCLTTDAVVPVSGDKLTPSVKQPEIGSRCSNELSELNQHNFSSYDKRLLWWAFQSRGKNLTIMLLVFIKKNTANRWKNILYSVWTSTTWSNKRRKKHNFINHYFLLFNKQNKNQRTLTIESTRINAVSYAVCTHAHMHKTQVRARRECLVYILPSASLFRKYASNL